MPRLTEPCSCETPLARCASRKPITAMLNIAGSPPSNCSAPSARIRSTGTPGQELSPPKYCATRSIGNRSMPAGTGVWVVNTVPARDTSRAASKVSPVSSVSSRIRSRPRKPAWPSLVWKTSGAVAPVIREKARIARTPPMPSSISWRSRCSVLPPYSRSVTVRMTSLFSSTSESSSSSGTRPTWATQIRAVSDCSPCPSLGRPISILATEPSASRSSDSGRPSGSRTG